MTLFNRRQSHKSFFDKSDLFFVCMLQPLSFDIQMQEREIEAAQVHGFQDKCYELGLFMSVLLIQ